MRLTSLTVNNFRQFCGEHEILFPYEPGKNVVVIHGDNGSGKTSLLNAFKWVLYGEVDFDTGDESLINDVALQRAMVGSEVDVTVDLCFEDDGRKYFLKRRRIYVKNEAGGFGSTKEDDVHLQRLQNSGCETIDKPNAMINYIIPKNLQPYFFFNGERIEKLSYSSRSEEIKSAIKNLMGLTIVERGIEHLRKGVSHQLRKDANEFASDELRNVRERKQVKETERDGKLDQLKSVAANISETRKLLEDIAKELKNIENVAKLEERREQVNEEIYKVQERKEALLKKQRSLISRNGFLPMAKSAFISASDILASENRKGRLPAKIRTQMVDDLLKSETCICGREISEGSAAYNVVKSLKDESSDEELETAFFKLQAECGHVERGISTFFDGIKDCRQDFQLQVNDEKRLSDELDEIDLQIGDSKVDRVREAQLERKRYQEIEVYNISKEAVLKNDLARLDEELEELGRKEENLKEQSGKKVVAEKRLEAADNVRKALEYLLEHLTESVREKLSSRVNRVFQSIITKKKYTAKISNDFKLEVYKPFPPGEDVLVSEKSTGESQVCSLSFVASIVADAKERHTKEDAQFYRGGVFPMVMDSPFGALDPEYRKLVAKYIPQLADQVIILVSGSQWRGEVQEECSHRVSCRYSLLPAKDNEHCTVIVSGGG